MSDRARADELLARIQELTAALEAYPEGGARAVADELVGAILAVYGDALERIMGAIGRSREAGATILEELTEDGVVSSLLLVHDLYPVSLEQRVLQALDTVRPYMESHGGNVEFLGIEGGVAHLALQGTRNGCAASRATLELAIKQALDEHCPDLESVEVSGVVEEPSRGSFELPVIDCGLPLAAL
jgi:Fe-S cluster biogenesis protein NfuA